MVQNKYNPTKTIGQAAQGQVSNQPKASSPYFSKYNTNVNSANRVGNWTMDHNDGGLYNHVNGKTYQVMRNDSNGKYAPGKQAYIDQHGGYADTSTVNNPTGFQQAKSYVDSGNEAQKGAVQQGINAALARLQGQKDDTNSQFDNSNKAAYINYMLGQKNMDQRLAASGLAKTGTSESTRLGAELNYQNMFNSNEQERDKALRDLANDMADVEAQGAKSLADLEAGKGNQIASLYTQLLGNAQNQWNADREYRQNAEQQNMDNIMNMANFLMNMNATGKTTFNQLKQLLPDLQGGDMNYYNLARQLGLDKMLK